MLLTSKKNNKKLNNELINMLLNNRPREVKTLINNGADVNTIVYKDVSILWLSASQGYTDIVETLLMNGADINLSSDGKLCLFIAAEKGHQKVVELLLNRMANINYQSDNGMNVLHIAAENGHADIVELLIREGINLHSRYQGKTAFYLAANKRQLAVLNVLMKNNVNINLITDGGDSALLSACRNGYSEIAEILIRHGANINILGKGGLTPLHEASICGHAEIVTMLLRKEADETCRDMQDKTALDYAKEHEKKDVVKLINSFIKKSYKTEPGKNARAELIALAKEVKSSFSVVPKDVVVAEIVPGPKKDKSERSLLFSDIKEELQPAPIEVTHVQEEIDNSLPVPLEEPIEKADEQDKEDVVYSSEEKRESVSQPSEVETKKPEKEEIIITGNKKEQVISQPPKIEVKKTDEDEDELFYCEVATDSDKQEKSALEFLDSEIIKAEQKYIISTGKKKKQTISKQMKVEVEKAFKEDDEIIFYDVITSSRKDEEKVNKPPEDEVNKEDSDDDGVFYCEINSTLEKEKSVPDISSKENDEDDGIFYL